MPERRIIAGEALQADSLVSRADFIRVSVAAGSLLVGGVLFRDLSGFAAASTPSASQDQRILNFVLLLEYLEAAFYAEAIAKGSLEGELRGFARVAGQHEKAHVAFLKKALGNKARREPKFDFGDATTDSKVFTDTAIALEDTGVSAYNGQAPNLTEKTLAAAASIVSVEARHAAWIRAIAGQDPAPRAVDSAKSADEVQRALQKTGFLASK